MITDAQIRYLKKIVDNEFDADILDKKRTMNLVNARLVYSYILRNRGTGLVRIAESINKNHATILYLLKNAPSYLKQDEELNLKYKACLSLFENHHSPIMDYTRRELLKAYITLDSQYDMLIKHNEELTQENEELKKTIEELDLLKKY